MEKTVKRLRFSNNIIEFHRYYFKGISFQKFVENAIENEIRKKEKEKINQSILKGYKNIIMKSIAKYHPILFSTSMIEAILNGIKSQTRRLIDVPAKTVKIEYNKAKDIWEVTVRGRKSKKEIKCRYGKPGDILWVRETFAYPVHFDGAEEDVYYKTDTFQLALKHRGKWRPSIHMPKEVCRIWLKITSIRAERLHSISKRDILSEGIGIAAIGVRPIIEIGLKDGPTKFLPKKQPWASYQLLFANWASLWCQINGRASWKSNPWVWVIEFRQISKPKNWIA